MARTLSIERVFNLGDYRSLRVGDTIVVPEGMELSTELVDALRIMQLTEVDLAHQRYHRMTLEIGTLKDGSDDRINALIERRANILEKIEHILEVKEE